MISIRKRHFEQIIEMLRTLAEAHGQLKLQASPQSITNLLADCQDFAENIGAFIGRLGGPDTKSARQIERYYELLYRASMGFDAHIHLKQLQKQLFIIESGVRTEFTPTRIEVVFLPYKASMFDCMESVWLAAKADPDCDAYVVPIPYTDRNPNGKFGESFYEGDQFPKYVQVTSFKEYDIEARHPDVIFIHNPYDDNNWVSCVHPNYYANRLYKHTSLLAYCPYFVVWGSLPEHFATLNGALYAHRTFVQSERVRDAYIRSFKAFEKREGREGDFGRAEEKFIASGSPKFDKALNARPDDFTLPNKWKRLLERPDGGYKPAVLYNNSIGAMLEFNEHYLNKLRVVLDAFRKRDDVVLWWRPHPLATSTYRSMRPMFYDEYEQIVAEYRREGFGIYDDTSDFHRALRMTEAYYGDNSSLEPLFQCAGKPVINQDTGMREAFYLRAFEHICEADGCFWFTTIFYNALFKMDKTTWEARYMGGFPGENALGLHMYRSCVHVGGKLYFAPYSAGRIAVYDINGEEFSAIDVPAPSSKTPRKMHYDRNRGFSQVFAHGSKLFFIPCTYPGVLVYDLESREASVAADWIAPLEPLITDPEPGYFLKGAHTGERLFLPCASASAVVEFDLNTLASKVHALGGNGGFNRILYDGSRCWLTPVRRGPLTAWNPAAGSSREYKGLEAIAYTDYYPFADMIAQDDHMLILPFNAEKAIKFDKTNRKFEIADDFMPECRKGHAAGFFGNTNYFFAQKLGGAIYAFTAKSGQFIEYDPATGVRREEAPTLSEQSVKALRADIIASIEGRSANAGAFVDCFMCESILRLDDFLDFISQPDGLKRISIPQETMKAILKKEISSPGGTAGAAIYEHCKAALIGG